MPSSGKPCLLLQAFTKRLWDICCDLASQLLYGHFSGIYAGNSILKENVGRPRPIHITEYGGTAVFQPPFVISNQCENNCSFVSGHAAFAFTFMVIGLLFRNRLRHIICTSGFIFGALVGFVRIFQGKHFFTDVVFAFFFTWLTITLIYKFFYPNDQLPDIIQKN